jgi:hypothetical protein
MNNHKGQIWVFQGHKHLEYKHLSVKHQQQKNYRAPSFLYLFVSRVIEFYFLSVDGSSLAAAKVHHFLFEIQQCATWRLLGSYEGLLSHGRDLVSW